jgi:hypothetical protein
MENVNPYMFSTQLSQESIPTKLMMEKSNDPFILLVMDDIASAKAQRVF